MITEVLGVNGQLVTTWGRDLEGDRWVGPERPARWVCTCRCAKTVGGPGFSSPKAVQKQGWVQLDDEWFCTLECAAIHEPGRIMQMVQALKTHIDEKLTDLLHLALVGTSAMAVKELPRIIDSVRTEGIK